ARWGREPDGAGVHRSGSAPRRVGPRSRGRTRPPRARMRGRARRGARRGLFGVAPGRDHHRNDHAGDGRRSQRRRKQGLPHEGGGYPCPAMRKRVEEQLKGLPAKPGVYLFRGELGDVLYVGKAKSLRPRVRSYFQAGGESRATIAKLPERVADVEVIVTDTEV